MRRSTPLLVTSLCCSLGWLSNAQHILPDGSRNKLIWPFKSDSIWNTAIGGSAQYVPSGLNGSHVFTYDEDWFVVAGSGDPQVEWRAPVSWGKRCGNGSQVFEKINFPARLLVPDASSDPHATPNNAAAVLQPDGSTLVSMNPLARCKINGPVYGDATPANDPKVNNSIYEEGQFGGHGGSGLSSIGGTIRLGELLPGSKPIQHVLKWEVFGKDYLYKPPAGQPQECFRWPAMRCDGYALDNSSDIAYNGTNPWMRQGTLLAVKPTDASGINASLATPVARKILQALVDYGAYQVDDTAWDAQQVCVEHGVADEVREVYGIEMSGAGGEGNSYVDDMILISKHLMIVNNSAPGHVGGGGYPRQPLPPPIGN